MVETTALPAIKSNHSPAEAKLVAYDLQQLLVHEGYKNVFVIHTDYAAYNNSAVSLRPLNILEGITLRTILDELTSKNEMVFIAINKNNGGFVFETGTYSELNGWIDEPMGQKYKNTNYHIRVATINETE